MATLLLFLVASFLFAPAVFAQDCDLTCPAEHHCEISSRNSPFCVPDELACNLECPEGSPVCAFTPSFEPVCVSEGVASCGAAFCSEGTFCQFNQADGNQCLPTDDSHPCNSVDCMSWNICVLDQDSNPFCVPRAVLAPPPITSGCAVILCEVGSVCVEDSSGAHCVPDVACNLACVKGSHCEYSSRGRPVCFPDEHPCSTVDCPPTAPACVLDLNFEPHCVSDAVTSCAASFCGEEEYCQAGGNSSSSCLPLEEGNPCIEADCLLDTLCALDADSNPFCVPRVVFQPPNPSPTCDISCEEGFHCEISNRGNPICAPNEWNCDLECPPEKPFCAFGPDFNRSCISEGLVGCSVEGCAEGTYCTVDENDQRSCQPLTEADRCSVSECVGYEICIQDFEGNPYCVPIALPEQPQGCNLPCPSDQHCEISHDGNPGCVPNDSNGNITCATVLCLEGTYCVETPEGPECLPPPQLTCANVLCIEGTYCLQTSEGPKCIAPGTQGECPDTCDATYAPVCGDDDVTYSNLCMLLSAACHKQRPIFVSSEGECSGNPCTPNCQTACPDFYMPVCGSDNVTYSSECVLLRTACLDQIQISVAYSGECNGNADPCEPSPCESSEICLRKSPSHVCVPCDFCPSTCPDEASPICGSDGVTYSGECRLRLAMCFERRIITVEHLGPCGQVVSHCGQQECTDDQICVEEVVTTPDETCQTPPCSFFSCFNRSDCPEACTLDYSPVCGSDGMTYSNLCQLQATICESQKLISVAHQGECGQVVSHCGQQECTDDQICVEEVVTEPSERCQTPPCSFFSCLDKSECPEACTLDYSPVCGSDGMTYSNLCQLQATVCELKKLISVAHQGECD